MSEERSAADVLWGPAPAPAPSATSDEPKSAAEALYGRDEDMPARQAEQAFISSQGSALREIESAAIERFELSPEDTSASLKEWSSTIQRYGIEPSAAREIVSAGIGSMAGTADQSNWPSQARAALQTEFGVNAQRVLDGARELIKGDARLSAWLEETGMGNHPATIVALCKKARGR